MPQMLPLAVALFYAFALFLFASWAEGDSHPVLKQRLRPPAYALALAVYCTSWTYYGAVGSAVGGGGAAWGAGCSDRITSGQRVPRRHRRQIGAL